MGGNDVSRPSETSIFRMDISNSRISSNSLSANSHDSHDGLEGFHMQRRKPFQTHIASIDLVEILDDTRVCRTSRACKFPAYDGYIPPPPPPILKKTLERNNIGGEFSSIRSLKKKRRKKKEK